MILGIRKFRTLRSSSPPPESVVLRMPSGDIRLNDIFPAVSALPVSLSEAEAAVAKAEAELRRAEKLEDDYALLLAAAVQRGREAHAEYALRLAELELAKQH